MKHLTYFENQTNALGKLSTPQVTYIKNVANQDLYPNGIVLYFDKDRGDYCEIKTDSNGDPILEGPLVPGYVDLGLSVMWAECNLGAESPEVTGDSLPFIGGVKTTGGAHLSISGEMTKLEDDPIYQQSSDLLQAMVQPKTPSPKEIDELLTNTTATAEIYKNQSGTRYTATNGNSIFVPHGKYWTNAEHYADIYDSSSNNWKTTRGVCWGPEIGLVNSTNNYIMNNESLKSDLLMRRGICDIAPKSNAKFLKQGESYNVDPNTLYCIRKDMLSSQFTFTSSTIKMMIAKADDFQTSSNVLCTLSVDIPEQNCIQMTTGDIAAFGTMSSDNYLYVKFTENTHVTIEYWNSEYLENTIRIYPNTKTRVLANTSSSRLYRFKYSDFNGYPITISNPANTSLRVYISATTDFTDSSTHPSLLLYTSISRRGSYEISTDVLNSWGSSIGSDGYLYARININSALTVQFKTDKPD